MTTTIWKASLNVEFEPQTVSIPVGATIIRVAQQNGRITMWFKFNNNNSTENEERKFIVAGTGQLFDDSCTYLGSCEWQSYVWHVLEVF